MIQRYRAAARLDMPLEVLCHTAADSRLPCVKNDPQPLLKNLMKMLSAEVWTFPIPRHLPDKLENKQVDMSSGTNWTLATDE